FGYATQNSYAGVQAGLGSGSALFQDNMEYQIENILNYNNNVQRHNFDLTFVQSISESKYSRFNNDANNFPNDLLGIYGLESAQTNIPSIGANRRGLVSF